ncbi:MAG: universal stress protein [Haloarculaceae archaeon]
MYEQILIPTDGSDASMAAVEQGVELAANFDATVHFLHVVDVGIEMSASGVGTIADELSTTLETMATQALDRATEQADVAGVSYERTILEGFPHEAITEYSAEHEIDLIVLGASGRAGFKERLLGSTTDRVTRVVDVSVLIARS